VTYAGLLGRPLRKPLVYLATPFLRNLFSNRLLPLGPLAGKFPLLSLRTNKADVVVGVDKEVAERLDKSGEKWRVDGR